MRARIIFSLLAALGLVTAASAQDLVINEIYYDGPGTDAGTFVEILGPGAMDLSGYVLAFINGNGGVDYATVDLNGVSIPADGYLVLAQDDTCPEYDVITGIDPQNGPDAVELRDATGAPVDGICYGESPDLVCEGGTAGPDVPDGSSLSRCPDGVDTNDNAADTAETVPTPGVENACSPEPTDYTMCEAVAQDPATGEAIHLDELVHITDQLLVLSNDGTFSVGALDCGVTSGECCATLFNFDYYVVLNEGDLIEVTGMIDQYAGLVEITGPNMEVTVISSGNPLPDPEAITTEELTVNGNDYESCLISICGLEFTGGLDPWPAEGSNANVEVMDGTGVAITLRVDKETDIDGSLEPEQPFTCIGLGSQYDWGLLGGWQIKPRSTADVLSGVGCPTPTDQPSWGKVKSMFR